MKIGAIQLSRLLLVAIAILAISAKVKGQGAPDFSKVEIETTKLADNFYALEGQGGRIGVLVGSDGVLMVDSEFAPLSEKIVAAIRKISDQPIKFMVNTHVHPDHTGGDVNFGKMGVVIMARDELRERLMEPVSGPNGRPATPAAGLPTITYEGPVTIHMDGEEVDLIPVRRAHTDGDTMLYFRHDDIIMTGDFYRSVGYPNIDRTNGGSLNGMLDGLATVIGMSGPNTKIVPGHGPIVSRAEVVEQRDMILVLKDKVAKMVQEGMTQEQVLAAHPTADYDSKVPQASTTADRFVGQLYAELKS
jgi:cyclase